MISRLKKIGITIDFRINFFSNGLQQNIIFLHNLINNLENFKSYLIYQGKLTIFDIVENNQCTKYSDLLKDSSLDFDLIILMGFTFNNSTIASLKEKNNNTKFVLMQCGNQYIENMTYSLFSQDDKNPVNKIINLSEIWILPHYKKNISYMKTYFKNNNVKLVPYIWDSLFIDYQLNLSKINLKSKKLYQLNNKSIIVMEPNFNTSKNCILPLYVIESFEHKYPNMIDSCNLIAANKLGKNEYFIKLILQLDLYNKRKNFLKLYGRQTLINVIKNYGSILLSHQQDNELNYLYLEALYLNIPLLHNSLTLSKYGYFYPENDILIAVKQLKSILENHNNNISIYKEDSEKLLNDFSTRNINNQKSYRKLIRNLVY